VSVRNTASRPRDRSRGFSLVEVVVALGLLAGVLISISGLFALANRQLDGGRNHSTALAVAKDILEEMEGWGYSQVWSTFGVDGSAARHTVDTRTNGFAAKWQAMLESELVNCYAEIELASVDDSPPGPALRDAGAIRVRVTVHWEEGPRSREVSLATVRL
jgi:type II secretory pathway pseudopilin PulG